MRFLTYVMLVIFTILPAVVSGQSTVYRLCKNSNSSHDICYWDGTGKYRGHERIMSFVGQKRYEAYFFPNREFSVIEYDANNKSTSIHVANNGVVGRNLANGEYYPNNKNFNNTLPEIRAMLALSD